jgi:hypothetical protein
LREEKGMTTDLFKIRSLTPAEGETLLKDIEDTVARKIREGVFTEREIREIEEMRLKPLPDIQDVQSVYENHLFKKRD